jgi:hemerythrin-like domain-containing protein
MAEGDIRNDPYELLLEEHKQLRSLLSEVGAMFTQKSLPIKDLGGKLQQLDDQVNVHFHAEEASECFPELVSNSPRVSDRVMTLLAEHGELRVEIHDLVHDSLRSDGTDDDWRRLAAAFEQFAAKLLSHERVENELVQEVFTDDIGSKD